MHIQTDEGITLACHAIGNPSSAPLVLVHGLLGNHTTMQPLAERLSDSFYCITYDCRGHGHSSKPAAYTLQDHACDLNAVIRQLAGGQAGVFGYSMGSYIAAQTAISFPAAVSHLALAVTKIRDDGHGSSIARLLRQHGLNPAAATEEEIQQLTEQALWSAHTSPDRRAELTAESNLLARQARMPLLTSAQRLAVNQALIGFDLSTGLPSIRCPSLVLAGQEDGINPPQAGRQVADLIPNSRFIPFERAGHMLRQEQTDLLEQTLRDFFTTNKTPAQIIGK